MRIGLKADFAFVRRRFFPRWKAGENWHIVPRNRADYTKETGYCDSASRTIHVHPLMAGQDGESRTALIIHEVCHAVTKSGHGKRFQQRMLHAADKARQLDLSEVAKTLEQEVHHYQDGDAWDDSAKDVYDFVERAVIENKGRITYNNVVEYLAGSYGLLVEELEARFRRLRRVYEKAIRKVTGVA